MPGITGAGLTFDLPNFVGDLFSISPEETPLLSAIGGLTGGRVAYDKQFEWQFYDLRGAQANRSRVEGDDAPTPAERVRQNANNVVEIHQETVSISYTRASTLNYGTAARGASLVSDEMAWQLDQQFKTIARDVEASFIEGEYANPNDNSNPRKTRGLIEAIAHNVVDLGGGVPTIEDVNDLFHRGYENGGFQEGETRTLIVGSAMKRHLTKLFILDPGLTPLTRTVGGASLTTIETDFGTANLMLSRYVPDGTIIAVSLEELAPRFLEVPGRGHFFVEPLGKVGARDESQIYGEIGLEYGNERKHAKLVDATTPYDGFAGSGSGTSGS